jgi:hypothetical protein
MRDREVSSQPEGRSGNSAAGTTVAGRVLRAGGIYEPDADRRWDSAYFDSAQGQQPNTAKLKADAQNVVKIISGDKLKTQTYCEIVELDDEIDEEQGSSKAEELSQKVDKLVEKLDIALVSALKDVDPNSQDGQEIGSILGRLDDLCGD